MKSPKAPMTLEAFAEMHGLEMEVHRREAEHLPQYYARFAGAEVKTGNILTSTSGDGDTIQEAIEDYAKQIQGGQTLVIGALTSKRRELVTPRKLIVEDTYT